jgi:hypothetical protein
MTNASFGEISDRLFWARAAIREELRARRGLAGLATGVRMAWRSGVAELSGKGTIIDLNERGYRRFLREKGHDDRGVDFHATQTVGYGPFDDYHPALIAGRRSRVDALKLLR